ncbi:EAL domain-containing protein [Brucella intermedia]|uniref:EAL domain-containing protein n=1 Tax=Brucella intermedia TaxID=94625 RepID=UPI00124C4AC9|nr:EAL domain-containing protein [Brucella intermedia]KAB2722398.1 EAL domain-containing protein [Brucella intermedia]
MVIIQNKFLYSLIFITVLLGSAFTVSLAVRAYFVSTVLTTVRAKGALILNERMDQLSELLDQFDGPSGKYCDPKDIQFLKTSLFSQPNIKDIGRTDGRKLMCTAIFGRLSKPFELEHTPISLRKGGTLYWQVPFPFSNQANGYIIRRDGLVIMMSLDFFSPINSNGIEYKFYLRDEKHRSNQLFEACFEETDVCLGVALRNEAVERLNNKVCFFSIIASLAITLLAYLFHRRFVRNYASFDRMLFNAIRRDELDVHYQPIVCLKTGKIVGAEALLRWPGSTLTIDEVITSAERAGVTEKITRFVLERISKDFLTVKPGILSLRVSLNISATDLLSEDFLMFALKMAKSWAGRQLCFELTEREHVCFSRIIGPIALLRKAGILFYIDDFGTGYSTAMALLELEVDGVKIDRSITASKNGLEFIRAVCAIGESSKLEIVAEGIETIETVRQLLRINDRMLGQGWFFSRPLDKKSFLEYLSNCAEGCI